MGKPWTASASLPGGDFPFSEVDVRISDMQRRFSFMPPRNVKRIFRAYGTEAEKVFDGARFAQDMGQGFGMLTEREIDYLKANEWASDADDILWRRSKLGLHMSAAEQDALRSYMEPGMEKKGRKRAGA
jgi:glycerol-3-phosphate dehydrogenase